MPGCLRVCSRYHRIHLRTQIKGRKRSRIRDGFALDLDLGFVFVALLGILGAALVGGGVVAYRGSKAVIARAFSAASVVAGLAMWFVIASVTITSSSGTAPEPVVVTSVMSSEALTVSEQTFLHLLTVGDVKQLLTAEAPLTTTYRGYKEMAENVDPAQVVNIDSWFGLTLGGLLRPELLHYGDAFV